MAECDANYMRLVTLFRNWQKHDQCRFQLGDDRAATDVTLEVIERNPYTTLWRIVQTPSAETRAPLAAFHWHPKPTMTIRLYHDAKSAEVVEYQNMRHFRPVYEYPNAKMHQPDEKFQLNRLLSEFLSLCLSRGVDAEEFALQS